MTELGEVFLSSTAETATLTQKLTIGSHDLYISTSWDVETGVLNYLDLKLSQGIDDNLRSALELVTIHVGQLVKRKCWSIDDMLEFWRGSHMEPSGSCPQIECMVSSPLDAVARYLERKRLEVRQLRLEFKAESKSR